eukprot:34912-Hanusia_phi.AAC.1
MERREGKVVRKRVFAAEADGRSRSDQKMSRHRIEGVNSSVRRNEHDNSDHHDNTKPLLLMMSALKRFLSCSSDVQNRCTRTRLTGMRILEVQ